jgi:hypothetical protein
MNPASVKDDVMSEDPLSICNEIFRKQGKACSMLSLEIDCHKLSRARRDYMRHQISDELGPAFNVTNDSRRFRITIAPPHRASA